MEREQYMEKALELARQAAQAGEVPVGAIVVDETGTIIGQGRNRREEFRDAVHHAEIEAIQQACHARDSWRLTGCTLYVTLEPCPMCAGAVINARVPRVVYGAKEPVTGSCGSVINLFEERYGHHPAVFGGVLGQECAQVLQNFFQDIRMKPSDDIRE
jgi:tRNA(adenine34) deaminase